MTSDALLFFTSVPRIIFSLFTSITIPGLGITPAVLMLGIMSIPLIKFTMIHIFNIGDSVASRDHGKEK